MLRDADVLIPKLPAMEPLLVQDRHFLDCVRERRRPLTDGRFARDVVLALEALQRSLRNRRVTSAGMRGPPAGSATAAVPRLETAGGMSMMGFIEIQGRRFANVADGR